MLETELTAEENLRLRLREYGLQDAHFDHEKGGVFFYRATREEKDVVIKAAPSPKTGVDRVKNQAFANSFLHDVVRDEAIEIPDTIFEHHDSFSFAIMDAVPGVIIAESRADGMREEMTATDISSLMSWLVAVRRIPTSAIPKHFIAIAEDDWNEAFYRERLVVNAEGPIAQGTLTLLELQGLQSLWARHYGAMSFQHHDVVPFNMIRKPAGNISLIDGEFARIGMVGYDAAYFAIQTYCLYGRSDLAKAMLEGVVNAWKSEFPADDMAHSILAPLAYRIVANLNDAPTKTNKDVRERTVHLKTLILQGDIQSIIHGLV